MSKVDALRAMREAKYARNGAAPTAPGAAPVKAVRAPVTAKPAKASTVAAADDETTGTGELCGHRNMGGKSCSRPAGHSEKNHRYATA